MACKTSLTRDRTRASCIQSVESQPLDHQGKSILNLFLLIEWLVKPERFQQLPSPVSKLHMSLGEQEFTKWKNDLHSRQNSELVPYRPWRQKSMDFNGFAFI